MNAEQLLADLRGRGITLALSDDGARVVVTPASALTAQDRQAIKVYREVILFSLSQLRERGNTSIGDIISPRSETTLSDVDHAIAAWIMDSDEAAIHEMPSPLGLAILRLEGCPAVAMRQEDVDALAAYNQPAHERALKDAHASPPRRKARGEKNESELFALEESP